MPALRRRRPRCAKNCNFPIIFRAILLGLAKALVIGCFRDTRGRDGRSVERARQSINVEGEVPVRSQRNKKLGIMTFAAGALLSMGAQHLVQHLYAWPSTKARIGC